MSCDSKAYAILGGYFNVANGDGGSTVSGGDLNIASGTTSTVSGGLGNTAGGDTTAILGGSNESLSTDEDSQAGSTVFTP